MELESQCSAAAAMAAGAQDETAGEWPITRRCFVCAAAGAVVAGALAGSATPALAALARAPESKTVDVRRLTTPGQSMLAPFQGPDGASVLIVRESATHFAALSLLCTHMGCPVNMPVQGILTCPCHGSQFDLDGKVIHGPAVYPLGTYEVTYEAKRGVVVVKLET